MECAVTRAAEGWIANNIKVHLPMKSDTLNAAANVASRGHGKTTRRYQPSG